MVNVPRSRLTPLTISTTVTVFAAPLSSISLLSTLPSRNWISRPASSTALK
ncbi:Uncharacterised protein [Vibrio cholerae]|nr:Uncharacterised protein [Vibrio cholerae]CSI67038.1 Uncharacterised protein [Vibrio cholerae]CSI71287.1 Uncharacterised protein [Vibrio cholerae]